MKEVGPLCRTRPTKQKRGSFVSVSATNTAASRKTFATSGVNDHKILQNSITSTLTSRIYSQETKSEQVLTVRNYATEIAQRLPNHCEELFKILRSFD
jgi:hypothetical protein